MKTGVLGTGMVGEAIATKLVNHGHEVMIGSRTTDNVKATAWASLHGNRAKHGTFEAAANFGELIFNCTLGSASLEALHLAGEVNLADKILIDVSNPLDFSKGMPPTLLISNTDSLGEQIQRSFPKVKVVKALNTINCYLMVNPSLVPGDHNVFVCGNDHGAKKQVINFISENFGWKLKNIVDLGDITNSRGTESLLPLWLRIWGKYQSALFNFHVVLGPASKM